MEKMMESMGAALWAVVQEGTEIEVVENSRGDAYNVYDRRIDRANSELSKLILQQTMTIEDGSSLSQSQTHLEVFKNLIEQDCDMLRDIINNVSCHAWCCMVSPCRACPLSGTTLWTTRLSSNWHSSNGA